MNRRFYVVIKIIYRFIVYFRAAYVETRALVLTPLGPITNPAYSENATSDA